MAPEPQQQNKLLILECPFVARPDYGAKLDFIRSEDQCSEIEAKKFDIWLHGKNLTKNAMKSKAHKYDNSGNMGLTKE